MRNNIGDIGFAGLLAIAFIILKLCGVIAWSWIWVLSPIWIPAAIVTGLFIAGFIAGGVAYAINRKRK